MSRVLDFFDRRPTLTILGGVVTFISVVTFCLVHYLMQPAWDRQEAYCARIGLERIVIYRSWACRDPATGTLYR